MRAFNPTVFLVERRWARALSGQQPRR